MKSSLCKDRRREELVVPPPHTEGTGQLCSQASISDSFYSHWVPMLLWKPKNSKGGPKPWGDQAGMTGDQEALLCRLLFPFLLF